MAEQYKRKDLQKQLKDGKKSTAEENNNRSSYLQDVERR